MGYDMPKVKRDKNSIHFSNMTGKLKGLRAISTNTITNPFCIKMNNSKKDNVICKKCYSFDMLETYRKNMQDCLQHNSELLSNSIIDDVHLPFIIDAYIRIDAHGELINNTHLINIYNLAIKNPHTTFAIWSKRKDIVNSVSKIMDTPSNVILIFSNAIIDNVSYEPPKHFHKVFNNVTDTHKEKEQNCTGQICTECMACYRLDSGVDVIIEAEKKNGRTIKTKVKDSNSRRDKLNAIDKQWDAILSAPI
jgi:hypothetical protein